MTWVIDCGHWHCPDRYDTRHGHTEAPETCPECAESPPESDRARGLRERAQRIAQKGKQAMSTASRAVPIEDRFWTKVDKSAGPDGCWLWTASINRHGYGVIGTSRGATALAHRISYTLTSGDPGVLHVLHHCDNRPCVNPAHLFLGTNADNMADMVSKNRCHPGERHPSAKLTDELVTEMRRQYQSGAPYRSIAAAFGMSETQTYAVCTGKSWRHLPMPALEVTDA